MFDSVLCGEGEEGEEGEERKYMKNAIVGEGLVVVVVFISVRECCCCGWN